MCVTDIACFEIIYKLSIIIPSNIHKRGSYFIHGKTKKIPLFSGAIWITSIIPTNNPYQEKKNWIYVIESTICYYYITLERGYYLLHDGSNYDIFCNLRIK